MSGRCAKCAAWCARSHPTRPLSWAATCPPYRVSRTWLTPTTSSRATASRGCARIWGKIPPLPSATMGWPLGCNFCTTSAFFGGKGKMLTLYNTGAELFRVMEEAERSSGVQWFFILDENFLLQRRRALELLALMNGAGKSWTLHIFSSANAIAKYRHEELVELGIASIWIGLESPHSDYA